MGTSGVKLLLVNPQGQTKRAKCPYESADLTGWCDALKKAVTMLKEQDPLTDLSAIALSSQVGTYLLDTGEVLPWNSAAGARELPRIQAAVTQEEWLREIGMAHPELVSYPLPRLLHIKEQFPQCRSVLMPKELLLRELTGNTVTDIFSWRGLCHPDRQAYSQMLLERFGIDLALPRPALPTDLAGCITPAAAQSYGLPESTPVYVGCNDFFAGLLGMGVWEEGTVFELSGTSEHLGLITPAPQAGKFVSGPYFNGCATYGGTKASGVSCDFAIRHFGIDDLDTNIVYGQPPIFLPYLTGERAPIYDENARGVFFGITGKTTAADMAYAVLEGVVFSLYHIGESLGLSKPDRMIIGGGSAVNPLMAKLKATLFGCQILRVTENDSSALGAAMLAMVGSGVYACLADAAKAVVSYETAADPDKGLHSLLQKRFAIYKDLYVNLKNSFENFSQLGGKEK